MKTTGLLILSALYLSICAVAQSTSIELSFSAQNNGHDVSLDSIMIMNLSQAGDTMLYAPDTVLVLYIVGVNQHEAFTEQLFSISQNYPNPFTGHTFIETEVLKTDRFHIRILDLSGRVQASFEKVLDAGKHRFSFYPGHENGYIFSVSGGGITRSIKLVTPISERADCTLGYEGFEQIPTKLKLQKGGYFTFSLGDELRYIGYSKTIASIRGSDVIEDMVEQSATYQFDITEGIPCVDVPTVSINFQVYKTVQIGTQCWFKESLNTGIMIPGIEEMTDNGILEKYCFDDLASNCQMYGGLYQWREAMQYSSAQGAQGICPSGWHIPTDEEWKQLEGEVDSQYGYPDPEWDKVNYRGFDVGQRLKSRNGWNYDGNGTNSFGFSALATGCRRFDGVFLNTGNYSGIWSSTEADANGPWYRFMEFFSTQVNRTHNTNLMGRPVRCIKDE